MSILYQTGYMNNVITLNKDFINPILYNNSNIIGFNNNILYSESNTSFLVIELNNITMFEDKYGYKINVVNGISDGFLFIDSNKNYFTLIFENISYQSYNGFAINLNTSINNTIMFDNITTNIGIEEIGYKTGNIIIDNMEYFTMDEWTFSFTLKYTYYKLPSHMNISMNIQGVYINIIDESNLKSNSINGTFDIRLLVYNENIDYFLNNKLENTYFGCHFTSNVLEIFSNIEYNQLNQTQIEIDDIKFSKGKQIEKYIHDSPKNIFLGSYSGYHNQGTDNIFLGVNSGFNNRSGNKNISIGNNTCNELLNGFNNITIGHESGFHCNNNNNVYIGSNTAYWNEFGYDNTVIGNDVLNYDLNYSSGFIFEQQYNNNIHPYDVSYIIMNNVKNLMNANIQYTFPNYDCLFASNILNYNEMIKMKIYFTYDQLFLIDNLHVYQYSKNLYKLVFQSENLNVNYDDLNDLYKLSINDYLLQTTFDNIENFFVSKSDIDNTFNLVFERTPKDNTMLKCLNINTKNITNLDDYKDVYFFLSWNNIDTDIDTIQKNDLKLFLENTQNIHKYDGISLTVELHNILILRKNIDTSITNDNVTNFLNDNTSPFTQWDLITNDEFWMVLNNKDITDYDTHNFFHVYPGHEGYGYAWTIAPRPKFGTYFLYSVFIDNDDVLMEKRSFKYEYNDSHPVMKSTANINFNDNASFSFNPFINHDTDGNVEFPQIYESYFLNIKTYENNILQDTTNINSFRDFRDQNWPTDDVNLTKDKFPLQRNFQITDDLFTSITFDSQKLYTMIIELNISPVLYPYNPKYWTSMSFGNSQVIQLSIFNIS